MDLFADESSSAYEGTRMKMFGTYKTPCRNLVIDKEDKIMEIEAQSDGERLRTLIFRLASGNETMFGHDFNKTGERPMLIRKYDLQRKRDLLGVFGHVMEDEDDEFSYHIVSLGFITNDCPGRSLLEHERQYFMDAGILHEFEQEIEKHSTTIYVVTMVLFIVVASIALIIYFCICKKRR